jgi:hypothetical protein
MTYYFNCDPFVGLNRRAHVNVAKGATAEFLTYAVRSVGEKGEKGRREGPFLGSGHS